MTRKQTSILIIGIIVIGLSAYGFSFKFFEMARAVLTDPEACYALMPVLNYVIVAVGFACLFVWSLLRGQFHDVEAPKYRMLEMEEECDRLERDERLAAIANDGREG